MRTKIAALKQRRIPIFEPDLDKLVDTGINSGRPGFEVDLSSIGDAEAYLLPSERGPVAGTARGYKHVRAEAREIATRLKDFTSLSPNRRCRAAARFKALSFFLLSGGHCTRQTARAKVQGMTD